MLRNVRTRKSFNRVRAATEPVDLLETRRLFTTPIFGTAGNDTFVIDVQSDNRIFLLFNGTSEILPAPTGGDLVEVFGGTGNDNIWVQRTNDLEFKIYDTGGSDVYRVGQGNVDIDLGRDVTLFDTNVAGDAPDTLTIEDGVGDGTPWLTDGTKFLNLSSIRQTFVAWTLGSEDIVSLNGGTGGDRVYVDGVRPNFRMNLSAGNDTLDLGGSDNRCDFFIPGGNSVVVDGGTGSNTLLVDDSSAASTLQTILLNDTSLLGGIDVDNFAALTVSTHVIPGDAEWVQFTGAHSPGMGDVNIIGSTGADRVRFGTSFDSVPYGSGYFGGAISLSLAGGFDQLEVYDGISPDARQWTFTGNTVRCNGQWPITSSTFLEAHIYGTDHADSFMFNSVGSNWAVFADGRAGNDTFTNGTANDIDAAFGSSAPLLTGGAGIDSLFLGDTSDQVGDVDEYGVSSVTVTKGDFGGIQKNMVFMLDSFELLNLACDADGNTIRFFDDANLALLEIDGGNGNDIFTNVRPGTTGANMNTTLAVATSLTGGAGSDTLTLDDHFGSVSTCDINAGDFAYTNSGTRHIQFNTLDRFSFDANDSANTIHVLSNPTGSPFAVNGAGGNDTFTVGGGDIDSNGFTLANATVTGGLGADSITFDDSLDTYVASESETYAFETLSLAKGASAGFSYAGFEAQKLNVGGGSGNGNLPSTVNINATSGSMTNTFILGGASRASTVNVGNPFLVNIAGTVSAYGLAGGMTVNYNDAVGTGNRQYLVSTSEVSLTTNVLPHLLYSNLTTLNINAGSGNDEILVEGLPLGTTLNAHGNNGNDLIVVGNFGSFITTVLGNVNAFGDAGTDQARWSSFDSQPITATLTASAFIHQGHTFSYNTVESAWVNFFNTQSLTLAMQGDSVPTTITGGSGNDSITVGGGNFAANIHAFATINGGNGDDSITFDDSASNVGVDLILDPGEVFTWSVPNSQFFSFDTDNAEHMTINAGGGNDYMLVNTTALDLSLFGNNGDDAITVYDSTGVVTVNSGAEAGNALIFPGDLVSVNADAGPGDVGAIVRVVGSDTVYGFNVITSGNSAGVLRLATGATLAVTGFVTLNGGAIDLAGGTLIKRAAATGLTLAQTRAALVSGYNAGAWNGTSASGAINSSLANSTSTGDAVGYGLGSEVAVTSVGGFTVAPGDTVIRYTLKGDADLNQSVNFDDLLRIAQNYSLASRSWAQGDFDYNSTADFSDLLSLAQGYGTTLVTSNILRRRESGAAADVL